MENLLIVAKQVVILFLLMGIGFFLRRRRILDEASSKGIVDLLILFVTPTVIVEAFMRPFDPAMMKGLGIAFTKKLADGDESTRRLSLCQGSSRADLTGYIPQGEWIDVAVVSDPVNRRFRYAVRSESNGTTWGNNAYLNETYSPAPYNHDYVLGADSATATEEAASAQWTRFNGLVRHLAIWKRSLSDDEVTEVFMGGSDSPAVFPDCWQVGFDGGDAKYFAAGGTGTFRVGKDPFYLMNGELPIKGSELAFSFDVGVTNANHAQVLRVRTTSDSAPGELALIIGGEEIAKAAVTADNVATLFVPGAQLSAKDVDGFAGSIATADFLLLNNEVPEEVNLAAVEIAKHYGVKIIFNPAPARKLPKAILEAVSIFTPNEFEEASLGRGEDAAATCAEIVTTLGSKGCRIRSTGEVIPAPSAKAVDSTGAGDTFNAVLAVRLAEGETLREACVAANEAASQSVAVKYVMPSLPRRA